MAEFSGGEEKIIRENEPIVFENKTDSSFDVGMGVVFRKSGIYDVSIVGNKTVVKKLLAAQPEIVRCKDCKYRGVGNYCVYGTRLAWVTKSNDFCSRAERREE